MAFNDVFDDGQSETGTASRAAATGVGAIESPGQMRQVLCVNTFSVRQ